MMSERAIPQLYVSLAKWFGLVLSICILFILFWDIPLAWYFETEISKDTRAVLGTITEAANSAIWFSLAICGYALCWLLAKSATERDDLNRLRQQARSWVFMIVSMGAAAFLVNVLKLMIGRYKPRYLFNDDVSGFEPFGLILKMASFPSGHAQSIWSAMIALCFLTPRFAPIYLVVAMVVSATRFLTAVHFVSDVIMSVFLSAAVALVAKHWFERNGQLVKLSPN